MGGVMEEQNCNKVRAKHPVFVGKELFEDMKTASLLYKIYQNDDVWMYFGHQVHVIKEEENEEGKDSDCICGGTDTVSDAASA